MMTSMSPMMYSFNNPVNFNDPLGLMGQAVNGGGSDDDDIVDGGTLPGIVVTANKSTGNYIDFSYILDWKWSRDPLKRASALEYQENGIEGVYRQRMLNRRIRRTEGLGYETEFMKGLRRVMGGFSKGIIGSAVAIYAAPMMAEMAVAGINSGAFSLTGSTSAKAIGGRMFVEGLSQTVANVSIDGWQGTSELDVADVLLSGVGLNYIGSAGLGASTNWTPFSDQNKFTTVFNNSKSIGTAATDFGVSLISGGQESLLKRSNLDRNLVNVLNGWNQTKVKGLGAVVNTQINEE